MALKLLEHTYKDIDLFYSRDMKEEQEISGEIDLNTLNYNIIRNFIELNPEYNALIEAYSKKNNLERIAILLAHGNKIKNNWYYFNEDAGFPVQSWINKMDGKYKLLILCSCNPEQNEVKSKKSPMLIPNEVYSGSLLEKGRVQIELFLPGTGYIDSYLIEEELKKLKD